MGFRSRIFCGMITSGKKISERAIRLGLAATYLYSGYDLLMHPSSWRWALQPLPNFMQSAISVLGADRYLQVQGIFELALALIFLLRAAPARTLRIAALLAAIEMLGIIIFVGVNGVTFRDMGLLGASLALFFINQ